jgi:hypothetical protein
MEITREQLCELVHQQLDRLTLFSTKPSRAIPRDGIYFWYEVGELRQGQGQRVTRVGTHIKPSRLHDRIKEHYGPNREGSAFRRHLGGALMIKKGEPKSEVQEWYKARESPRFNASKFKKYETQVTQEANNGTYRVLKVRDAQERLELEEKLIALFSHCDHCRPSDTWLGNYAHRPEIRQAGLWNVQHTRSENEFLRSDISRLMQLVTETLTG